MATSRICIKFVLAAVGIALLLTFAMDSNTAVAGVAVDCEGSAESYRLQGIPCKCVGGRIVCNEGSSGGGSSSQKTGGLSYKNQMKLEVMQSVADMAANAFLRWLNDSGPSQKAPTQADWDALHEKQKAEWQARVQKQIHEMEDRYAEQERQEIKAKSAKLMSRLKGVGSSAAGPQSDLLKQLRCKAFWGNKAAREPDETLARKYSQLAGDLDAGALAECARVIKDPPMPAAADSFRVDLYQTIVQEISQRLPLIEEARGKQRDAVTQLAGKQQEVAQLKALQGQAPSAAEQQAADDLLAAALQELEAATTLKNEADAGVMRLQLEIDAFQEVEKIAANNSRETKKGYTP